MACQHEHKLSSAALRCRPSRIFKDQPSRQLFPHSSHLKNSVAGSSADLVCTSMKYALPWPHFGQGTAITKQLVMQCTYLLAFLKYDSQVLGFLELCLAHRFTSFAAWLAQRCHSRRTPVVVCTFFQASLPPRTSSTSFFFSGASLLICMACTHLCVCISRLHRPYMAWCRSCLTAPELE